MLGVRINNLCAFRSIYILNNIEPDFANGNIVAVIKRMIFSQASAVDKRTVGTAAILNPPSVRGFENFGMLPRDPLCSDKQA